MGSGQWLEIELHALADPACLEAVDSVTEVRAQNSHVVMMIGGDVGRLLKAGEGRYSMVHISTQSADLEEIGLTYHQDAEAHGGNSQSEEGSA